MTAPRSSSLRALRILPRHHNSTLLVPLSQLSHRRTLHITGVHSAQPIHGSERTSLYASRSLADLKAECQKRSLKVGGSTRAEMIETLSNHDMLQSRAFSIAMRRINGSAFSNGSGISSGGRHFNTSRSQKAVNDSSTVDFAYMPSLAEMDAATTTTTSSASPQQQQQQYFIPILSDVYKSYDPTKQHNQHQLSSSLRPSESSTSSTSESTMRPQIYTVSGDTQDTVFPPVSALSEVVDNLAVELDPYTLTETVGKARAGEEMQRERERMRAANGDGGAQGVVKELWAGFMEDVWGRGPKTAH